MALTRITEGVIKPNENYVVNNINSSGVTTSTNFKTGTSNLHNVGIEIAGINVLGADTPIGTGATIYDAGGAVFTGVVTATSFSGSGNISADGNVSGVDATFTGNVSIGGTLTYEDVTNIDSVGIVTARTGLVSPYADIDDWIDVGNNIQLGNAGVITATTFKGGTFFGTGADINGDIDVDGHTNLDNVSIAGVTSVASLTSGRVVTVGTAGKLQDSNNLTFDSSELTLTSRHLLLDTDGYRIKLGTANDFQLWHTGSANKIQSFVGNIEYISPAGSGHSFQVNSQEKLRITGGGHIVTQGLSDYSFNNDSSNAKILEVTGDGTVGEYGVVTVSSNQNANASNVGTLRFVNRENSNSSSGNNAGSKQVAAIQAYLKTSDTNAGDDSGGWLSFFTKNESAVNAEALRITEAGTVNIGGNYPQTTYKAQIQTGTNKFISFGTAAHDDLSNEGSGIFFSRQSDGSKELCGIFNHSNTGLSVSARDHIIFHAGGGSTYGAAPERMRITADGKIHTGSPAAYASDDFNITALGTGATLSLCRASTGNANDNDLLGSIAFQSYPSGQAHTAAEASIKAYAETGQSGSAAPTSLHFYTKPSSVGPGGSASQRLVIASDGEVFIGGNAQVTDRSTVLSISGPNQDPGGVWTQVGIYSEDSYAQNKGGSIGFGGQDGSTTKQQFAAISGVKETTGSGNYAGMMRFWTRPDNAVSQERMRIQSDGTVKIKDKLVILNGGAFTETAPQGLTVRNGGIYLEQGNDITWNNGDNSISGESGYHLLFKTYNGSSNTEKLKIRGGSGITNTKIQLPQLSGGFYHSHNSAGITPANNDWVYFGYVSYGSGQRGQFVVEWSSLQAPSCCYHGYAILEAGSSHGPDYDYVHSESMELLAYDSHGGHNFKAWKLVDSSSSGGSHLKIFGQWSGSTVQSGTFHMTVLPGKTMNGSTIQGANPAVDNNSYNGTRLTIDGKFQQEVTGYNPDQKRLNKSMFGIFHASSGLDTAGALSTRGTAAGANGTIWCNYGGLSNTRNNGVIGSYTPFAGMVAPNGAGARYLHVKFNITGGSMWMIDIKGYEYIGSWTSQVNGTSYTNDKIHHSISGGYHYNSNALYNGKSLAYRGVNPGWYLNSGYVCCYIDTTNTNTGNRWGFYKFEGGTDGIIGKQNQKPACVLAYTYSTGTGDAF